MGGLHSQLAFAAKTEPIFSYSLRLVEWSYSTTCVYSEVVSSTRVVLSPGSLLSGFTFTILRSRLFLNNNPCALSAIT